MKIQVIPGNIEVNSVSVLRANEHVIWLLVDTKQKYPEVYGTTDRSIVIGASDSTLYNSNTQEKVAELQEKQATEVSVVDLEGSWDIFYRTGRYDVEIILLPKLTEEERNREYLSNWYSEK